jgi:PadR family transcriptional regulator PadR
MPIQASGILLDCCVLSLLVKEDAYGYVLTQQMKTLLGVSESTLYPVMKRLQTDDCLTAYDVPHNGRNRRYYQITPKGLDKCREYTNDWLEFKQRVDSILQFTPIERRSN